METVGCCIFNQLRTSFTISDTPASSDLTPTSLSSLQFIFCTPGSGIFKATPTYHDFPLKKKKVMMHQYNRIL